MEGAAAEGAMAKLVVIELDKGDNKGNDGDVYATFKAVR